MKAYRTEWGGVVSIVADKAIGGAKSATIKAIKNSGYKFRGSDIECNRAPEYDAWAATARPGVCYSEDYVKECERERQTDG